MYLPYAIDIFVLNNGKWIQRWKSLVDILASIYNFQIDHIQFNLLVININYLISYYIYIKHMLVTKYIYSYKINVYPYSGFLTIYTKIILIYYSYITNELQNEHGNLRSGEKSSSSLEKEGSGNQ